MDFDELKAFGDAEMDDPFERRPAGGLDQLRERAELVAANPRGDGTMRVTAADVLALLDRAQVAGEVPPEPRRSRLSSAPCSKCGYNGPGYYQPATHPCAAGEARPATDHGIAAFRRGLASMDRALAGAKRLAAGASSRPAVEAITDEMVEAALREWIRQRVWPVDAEARPAMRAALVAAMGVR